MATYKEANSLTQQLKTLINQCIDDHPLVKSAIKAQKAVVWETPDTEKHTVAVKFLSDILNEDVSPATFPYNPKIPLADLAKGKTVFIFYSQSLSNGVVMQNATWSI